ncbi:hypothetical protein M407DRAFT_30079 [Tulasnella calospora MUT 4182]|uniref:F-box domain-containing protein n=1 Tax=Tulasnella calospora MUT 4182 TaxID=1051891 RepID=A0A0C3Q8X4_9AGAM|nr:hypothetical protein M407DRAFT_30079 [Tulasnella calospora MUT 4182]
MHHLWTIPELLDLVLNELQEADLPNMARVCKAFWAPTVRLIWQLVPSLSNLLSLFPEERQHVYRSSSPEPWEVVSPVGKAPTLRMGEI